ncbi:MAG TPA: peptidoglycan-binding protein [Bacillales bacterium]|nr:peptidoglycan-binding protein [Bacillales bacterium]
MESGHSIKKWLAAGALAAGIVVAAPAISETTAFAAGFNTHQLLSVGDNGQAVKQLQSRLHTLHFYNYGVDGIYGPITKRSVKDYQRSHHLTVDGIAGPKTLGSLFASQTRTQPTKTSERVTLQYGDRGQSAKNLQSKLAELGYYTYSVDGIFGRLTRNAVRSFQSDHGLVVDGVAGPHTNAALYGQKSAVAASSNTDSELVSHIIADAKALIGTPYVWGGESPNGFDCSGFVQYVFNENGIHIPRTTSTQWNFGKSVSTPKPGDLVFFHTTNSGPSHVGIYIGNRKFIQAGSSHGVKISDLDYSYWSSRYLGTKSVF